MILHVRATCTAYVNETWTIEVPDETPESEWEELASEKLFAAEATFIGQEVEGEHDRDITSVEAG